MRGEVKPYELPAMSGSAGDDATPFKQEPLDEEDEAEIEAAEVEEEQRNVKSRPAKQAKLATTATTATCPSSRTTKGTNGAALTRRAAATQRVNGNNASPTTARIATPSSATKQVVQVKVENSFNSPLTPPLGVLQLQTPFPPASILETETASLLSAMDGDTEDAIDALLTPAGSPEDDEVDGLEPWINTV